VIIEVSILVEAPPPVVYRFYSQLDHLRYVSPIRRREWCAERGIEVGVGREYEVNVQQGRHAILLRFRTIRADGCACIEDEFLNWPLKGARHVQSFVPEDEKRSTLVTDLNRWDPPWYARSAVKKHEWEQTSFFQEKLDNAKRVIEAVYRERGDGAFVEGIGAEAAALGIAPVIGEDE
jgi:ligand-binding SRPBCC domain-containing protein